MTYCHSVSESVDGESVAVERSGACPHSEDDILGEYQAEKGRLLANWRDDLIAQGADPSELHIPIHPDDQEDQ